MPYLIASAEALSGYIVGEFRLRLGHSQALLIRGKCVVALLLGLSRLCDIEGLLVLVGL